MNKVISTEYVEKNYISIKELKRVLDIEEYDNIDVLSHISTLMSEVDRLEDIEDRKVQIECQLIFDEGVKTVKDKIKLLIDKRNAGIGYTSLDCIEDIEKLLQGGQESDQEGGQEDE